MIANTLFVRVVSQDRDRGFMLLAGFDSKIVQATCSQYTTLGAVTRESLDKAIAQMKDRYSAAEIKDCTSPDVLRKLKKIFGEL